MGHRHKESTQIELFYFVKNRRAAGFHLTLVAWERCIRGSVSTAVPNFLIMESNYWKWAHQYPYFVNNVPAPVDGHVKALEAPGIAAEIKPELFKSGDAIVKTIAGV